MHHRGEATTGLQIEFYAGDAATIGAIFADGDDWDVVHVWYL
jgi:hypothetical protein